MVNFKSDIINICAVIVTYHPDYDFKKRIKVLIEQVDRIIIIDNNSTDDEVQFLKSVCSFDSVFLIENSINKGIANALNQGMDYAFELGYKWTLLLDQDTIVLPIMIEELMKVYGNYDKKERIGIIGSNYKDVNSEVILEDERTDTEIWCKKDTVITAGSLINNIIFKQVGKFNDEFFIDAVDTEYCLRVEEKGFEVLLTKKVLMLHSIGKITMHKFLGKKVGTTNHTPLRRYYMVRNNIALIKKYARKKTKWALNVSIAVAKWFLLVIIFEEKKIIKIRYMLKGLIEGLFMKL